MARARAPKRVLTELAWEAVFRARCKSKQGQLLTDAERVLLDVAYVNDRKRYAALEGPVFEATRPFGSTRRR